MSQTRDLPARPSLDSLRKQAKKLARDAAAGNGDALARVNAHLPRATLPLSNRDAQLVIAREYGFAGWSDLTAEAEKRLGRGLEWAVSQARVAIHDNDNDRLRALITECPALVSWRDAESGQMLLDYTTSYAMDCSEPERERIHTRPVAAEMLIDAGATVKENAWENVIRAGASGMLNLFARKNVLPRTLYVFAALGDDDAVGAQLDESADGTLIGRALLAACRFRHAGVAMRLLERLIALDPDLGRRIDRWQGRQAFVDFFIRRADGLHHMSREMTLWELFVNLQLRSALHENDLPAFHRWLEDEPWVLQPRFVGVQNGLIQQASYSKEREGFITALLERDAAILTVKPPPRSSAIVNALSYGNANLIPMLTRIWALPDDLPHAAGTGNAAAVARWFDAAGKPVLRVEEHYPANDPLFPGPDLGWDVITTQHVLDVALAWALLNHHFDIATFLLERGANINTDWSTHEPASILHEAAIHGDETAVRFLIDHGADLTMEDYRYQSNAEGWARYGSHDEHMANLLAAAAASRSGESV